jgi:hypothetical protein
MNQYIQIILAILIVIILFIVAMMVYDKEKLDAIRKKGKLTTSVPIYTGILDFATFNNISFNTIDPNQPNYVNLQPSINQIQGTAYAYNFWLYLDNSQPAKPIFSGSTDNTNFNQVYPDSGLTPPVIASTPVPPNGDDPPYILFLRGSNKVMEYKNICSPKTTAPDTSTTGQNVGTFKQDVLIKAPLVKLEHNGEAITVEFNTLNSPDGVKVGSPNTCQNGGGMSSDWYTVNQYKVGLKNINSNPAFNQKWFMITIVLEDTLPSDPLPLRNKIRCQIFVNGVIELDKYIIGQLNDPANTSANPLRINQGNIYINPTLYSTNSNGANGAVNPYNTTASSATQVTKDTTNLAPNTFLMADLTYFNYSLQPSDVVALFNSRFNTNPAVVTSIPTQKKLRDLTKNIGTNANLNVAAISPL